MIQYINVSKNYGRQQVIVEANFAIHDGERVGFVGPNGAGKSTLLEMLSGRVKPDHGECSLPGSLRFGYVRQQLDAYAVRSSLLDYVEAGHAEISRIVAEQEEIEERLKEPSCDGDSQEKLLKRLGDLQSRFEQLGGYEIRSRAEATLSGLGFPEERFGDPFRSFSGGWQIRAELSRILVSDPDILALDEPTNYLDVPAVEWLRDYLRSFPGTLLLVSHDRYLLNALTNVTLEVMGGHVTRYSGNYAQYLQARVNRHEQLIALKRNVDRKKEQLEKFIERFRYKATKANQAQSKQKQLDKLEDVEVQSITVHGPRIRLPQPPRSGDEVLRLENLSFSYDGLHDVISHYDLRLERGQRVAIVGLNGMGKTTLMRLMAGRLTPREGRVVVGSNVQPGYQAQDYAETMDPDATVYETAKSYASERTEADIRELLGGFGFSGEAIDKRVQVLSGGEKVRLGLARLLLKPLNFLMLDEPTTHLDIHCREALQEALASWPGTIVLVSHDIEFVRGVANAILYMEPGKITRFYGGYDYFREKLLARQAAEAQAKATATAPSSSKQHIAPKEVKTQGKPVADEAAAPLNGREMRRAESQLRQQFGKLKRPHEEVVTQMEDLISKLEAEQADIYAKLNDPAQAATADFEALNKRLAAIAKESEDATWKWEAASTEVEKLETELKMRLDDLKAGKG